MFRRSFLTLLLILLSAPFAGAQDSPARPNVLFIICDDLTTTAIHCYGNTICKTPNMDRLAAKGLLFKNAYCQWPLCVPSRNSFLSGIRPDNRFPAAGRIRERIPDVTFLPEYFRKNGYFTARYGKLFHVRTILNSNPLDDWDDPACWDISDIGGIPSDPCGYAVLYTSVANGLAAHPRNQAEVLEHELLNKAGGPGYDYWIERIVLRDGTDTTDANIARHVSALLEERSKGGKPFFLAAGFRRPHHVWAVPESDYKLYPPMDIPLPVQNPDERKDKPAVAYTRGAPEMTDDQRRKAISAYYASVTHVDQQLGVLLDTMDRLHLWDNTIVVFTSDHGWHLGEHGWLWGKVTLFEEAARVPLIVVAPNVTQAATTCMRPVEMLDYYPTLAELAGLPAPKKIDGTSIVPLLKNPELPSTRPAYSVVLHGKTWGKAVYTEAYRYTEWGDNAAKGAELYDLKADPHEEHNLVKDPDYAVKRGELKKLLDEREGYIKDSLPTVTGPGD